MGALSDSRYMSFLLCLSISVSYTFSVAPQWESLVGSLLLLVPCLGPLPKE